MRGGWAVSHKRIIIRHGCLVHFVNTCPYVLWNFPLAKKLLVNDKLSSVSASLFISSFNLSRIYFMFHSI